MKAKYMIIPVAAILCAGLSYGEPVKKVLVEKFTTEKCGFCPSGTAHLESAVAMLPQADRERVIQVYHHAGYGTDWLTLTADTDIVAFLYNDHGSVYAPAFMVDRADFGITSQNYHRPTPVFGDGGAALINRYITRQLETEAPVSVEISGTHDPANHIISLTVSGTKYEEFEDYPARVTVYVLEDGIKARSQASGGSNYIHDHTIRAFNSAWGDPVEWDGDNYTYSFRLRYPAECNLNNMEIVAAVNQYTKSDPLYCNVFNANSIRMSQLETTSVNSIEMTPEVRCENGCIVADSGTVRVFSLDGTELTNSGLQRGIYIAKVSTAAGEYSLKVAVR